MYIPIPDNMTYNYPFEIPKDDSRLFIFKSSKLILDCNTVCQPQYPGHYLLDRKTKDYNCRPKVKYENYPGIGLRAYFQIRATRPIKIGEPIVIYYKKRRYVTGIM